MYGLACKDICTVTPALLNSDSQTMYSYKNGVHISKFDDIALSNIKPFSLVIIYVCDARKVQWQSTLNMSTGTPTRITTKFFDETFWYVLSALFVNKYGKRPVYQSHVELLIFQSWPYGKYWNCTTDNNNLKLFIWWNFFSAFAYPINRKPIIDIYVCVYVCVYQLNNQIHIPTKSACDVYVVRSRQLEGMGRFIYASLTVRGICLWIKL